MADGGEPMDYGTPEIVNAALLLQLVGGVVLIPLLILTTALASSVVRHVTLVNLLMTWFLSALFHCLLFFDNSHLGPKPSYTLCLAQASLLYGVTPMTAVSSLAIVVQIYIIMRQSHPDRSRPQPVRRFTQTIFLILSPYFAFVLFGLIALGIGATWPALVSRGDFYCMIKPSKVGDACALFAAVVTVVGLVVFGLIARNVYISRKMSANRITVSLEAPNLFLLIRIFVYGVYCLIALIATILSIWVPRSVFRQLFFASIPLAVFIVFSTQKDILNVWSCGLLFPDGRRGNSLFDHEKEYFSIYTGRVRSAASSLKGKFSRIRSGSSVDLPPSIRSAPGPVINLDDPDGRPGYAYPNMTGRFPYSSASLGSSSYSRPSAVDAFAIPAPNRGHYGLVSHGRTDSSSKPLPPLPP